MNRDELDLYKFAVESNEIERYYDESRHDHHHLALKEFLQLKEIAISSLQKFVGSIEIGAVLRTEHWHKVKIGGRRAPLPKVSAGLLQELLNKINLKPNNKTISPFEAHAEYEYIHPFMDGNGRSGRAIWLWMMLRIYSWESVFSYSFLQQYYCQSLNYYNLNKE